MYKIDTDTRKTETKHSWLHQTKTNFILFIIFMICTQLTFTCSKSTTETLEKGMRYVQS